METFKSAADLLRHRRPERPVVGLRPHAAKRAARWFKDNFPGTVIYAVKANGAPEILEALGAGGIEAFDVASRAEAETMAGIPGAELYFMNPVKSRETVRDCYFKLGVRRFALDSEDELDKILAETKGADDLELYVRIACANPGSMIPLEGKFGIDEAGAPALLLKARQRAARLGVTFHVGSQAMTPEGYTGAMERVARLIREAGVLIDAVDVGGGFPSRYENSEPSELAGFMAAITAMWQQLAVGEHCALLCEPGRALVAEAESVLVRVEARRGNRLYINDGSFGTLYDAAHCGFTFPARLVRTEPGSVEAPQPFALCGPTCDSVDLMPGPYMLPACVAEGDYIEIGQIGAYGRVLANRFNGFGEYDQAILLDEPMLTMYPQPAATRAETARRARRLA